MEVLFLKVILASIFTLSVVAKLTGKTKSTFENAGYSPKLMYAIALVEILLTIRGRSILACISGCDHGHIAIHSRLLGS